MKSDTSLYSFISDLANGKEKSRVKVAEQLLSSSAEEREEAIIQGLSAKDFKVRRAAFALIGEMRDKQFAGQIMIGLKDKHSDVIQMAVWAMGKLRWKTGVPALYELLGKGHGFKVTKTIVWALGEMGDPSAVVHLKPLVQTAGARLTEGILVSGIKLGHSAFVDLIRALDGTQKSVQAALLDASRSSGNIRGAFIRAIVRTKDNQVLSSIVDVLPYVTFYDADYKRLAADARENVRLAVCHSIANSWLPKAGKQSLLIKLLHDSSNAVVKASLEHLSAYLNEEKVKNNIESVKAAHPSPKIRNLAESVIESEKIVLHMQKSAPKWGRYILETLPGLEAFVLEEADIYGIHLQTEKMGDGWLEVVQDEADMGKLRLLHTIRQVHGIITYEEDESDVTINPYVSDYRLEQLTNRLKHINIQSTAFQIIPLVTEREMIRPARTLRSTSLDWRVARAMILCTKPSSHDVFVDPTCGSGTLLLDRAAFGAYRSLQGGDLDEEAVQTARENLKSMENVDVQNWSAASLPLVDSSVSAMVSNLPFGRRVGDHEANIALYPSFIKEVNRVLSAGGRAVLFTQEVKLLQHAISFYKNKFTIELNQPVAMGGLTPHIIVLKKNKTT